MQHAGPRMEISKQGSGDAFTDSKITLSSTSGTGSLAANSENQFHPPFIRPLRRSQDRGKLERNSSKHLGLGGKKHFDDAEVNDCFDALMPPV